MVQPRQFPIEYFGTISCSDKETESLKLLQIAVFLVELTRKIENLCTHRFHCNLLNSLSLLGFDGIAVWPHFN